MEAMRTHGVSQSFTYANFRSVVRAVNKNFVRAVPNLKIGCEHRLDSTEPKKLLKLVCMLNECFSSIASEWFFLIEEIIGSHIATVVMISV
jgi:hypothetical protein